MVWCFRRRAGDAMASAQTRVASNIISILMLAIATTVVMRTIILVISITIEINTMIM